MLVHFPVALAIAVLGAGILSSAAFYGGMLGGHGRRGGPPPTNERSRWKKAVRGC